MFLVLFSGVVVWVISLLMLWHATKSMLAVLDYIIELSKIS